MARVYVYERAVNAVFTGSKSNEIPNLSNHGLKIKEEPFDSDKDATDDSSSNNEDTGDRCKIIAPEAESSDAVNRMEKEYVSAVVPTDSEYKKSNFYKIKRRSLSAEDLAPNDTQHLISNKKVDEAASFLRRRQEEAPMRMYLRCHICFLSFPNKKALSVHYKIFKNVGFGCKKCSAWFISRSMWLRHQKVRNCKESCDARFKYSCNFCDRKFPTKDNIQRHLFHSHRDLIYNYKIETILAESTNDLVARTPKASDNLYGSIHKHKTEPSGSNDTCAINLCAPNGARLKRFHSPTSTPLKRLKSPNTSPSRQMSNSNSSFMKRLKFENVSCSTPTKRLKQTTLTDFMPLYKKVEKVECVSPEEVTDAADASILNNDNDICNATPASSVASMKTEMSTPVEHPKINTPRSEIPFVRIHIGPGMMMELLNNKKLNSEPESSTTSSDRSYNLRSERTRLSDETKFSDSYCRGRKINGTPRQSRRFSQVQSLKAKFNCKECSVYLERCDQILIHRNYKLKNCGNSTKHNLRQDIAKVNRKKLYRCHLCSKHFSSKKKMREHRQLFHVVYMSSICNARYTSMNKLLSHYFRQHALIRQKCCVCREKFKSPVLLRQHMVLHCIKTTQSKKDTQSVDIEINCNGIKKQYKCKGCRKRFWLRSCLIQHRQACYRMNDRKHKQQNPRIKESPSSFSEETRNLKGNVTDAQYTMDCSTQYSSNDHPVQAPDMKQGLSLINAESPTDAVLCTPIKTDARISPSPSANGGNKRLINGIACVKGYQINLPGKVKFPCTICGKQFHTFQNLCIHERTFSKPANNRCNICGTTFPTKRLLQLHMLATHTPSCAENYRFFCKFCNQGFLKKGYLQSHERHFHISQSPRSLSNPDCLWNSSPVCNICNLVFETYERFIEHNMYYYKGQVFVCTFCNKSFQGMYQLHHHNKLAHNPESARKSYVYTCDVCNEGFSYESHFHAHKLHVHLCSSNSMHSHLILMQEHNYALTSNNIVETIEPIEVPAKTYTCNVCTLNFTNEEDLSLHDIEYSVDGDFHCNKCSRKCRTSAILAKHQSLNHAGCDINQSYKCRFCGEVSTTSMSMLCHEKHFHENNTNKATKKNTSNQLATDQNLNTDNTVLMDDTFTCLTCGMKFDNEINLKHHLLEYSNIGVYGCNICQRKFTELYLLEVHKVRHARVNSTSFTHLCPICNEGFTNAANIRTHVLHLHRYESFGTNRGQGQSENASNAQEYKHPISSNRSTNVAEPLNGFASPAANCAQKENSVKCPECDVVFSSNKNLAKHRSRYVNSGDNQCTLCGRRFPWVTSLEQHLRKHNTVENRFLKHKCSHCAETFRSSVAVYSHIVHIHGKDKLVSSGSDASKTNPSNVNQKSSTLIENSPPVKNLADSSEPLAMPPKACESDRDKITTAAQATILNELAVTKCAEVNALGKTAVGNILKNAERMPLCNLDHPTLKMVQPHFNTMHKKASEGSETSSSEAICKDEANSMIDSPNIVGDEIFQRMLELHSNCESPGMVLNPTIDKHDFETIEIVWEKKASLAPCVLLSDSDPDVQMIKEYRRPSVIQQGENSVSVNLKPPSSEVGRLKVRSFAKIVD